MVATLMLIKLWIPISAAMPAQMILPPVSFAFMPIKMQSITINNIKIMTTQQPTNPNSSPIIAKIKSVCGSEMKFPFFTDVVASLL